ncbi:MAG: hypothetical protein LBR55_07380, partial [Bacteroidales bacterium]|nr:hypothetical protein [Bacteroidales bacterium]
AEFLYDITKYGHAEWWYECRDYYDPALNTNNTRAIDFLVREIAAPYYFSENQEDYHKLFLSMNMYDFLNHITNNLQFDAKYPGNHINYWTYDKVKKMLQEVGFTDTIRSKPNTSICAQMRNIRRFDTNFQRIALYVDAIKTDKL